MKRLFILLLMLTVAGCQCSTRHGECIGVADDPVPGMRYESSMRNIILAIVFFETVIVPVHVIFFAAKCPTGPVKP